MFQREEWLAAFSRTFPAGGSEAGQRVGGSSFLMCHSCIHYFGTSGTYLTYCRWLSLCFLLYVMLLWFCISPQQKSWAVRSPSQAGVNGSMCLECIHLEFFFASENQKGKPCQCDRIKDRLEFIPVFQISCHPLWELGTAERAVRSVFFYHSPYMT